MTHRFALALFLALAFVVPAGAQAIIVTQPGYCYDTCQPTYGYGVGGGSAITFSADPCEYTPTYYTQPTYVSYPIYRRRYYSYYSTPRYRRHYVSYRTYPSYYSSYTAYSSPYYGSCGY